MKEGGDGVPQDGTNFIFHSKVIVISRMFFSRFGDLKIQTISSYRKVIIGHLQMEVCFMLQKDTFYSRGSQSVVPGPPVSATC